MDAPTSGPASRTAPTGAPRRVEVVLPIAKDQTFTYAVPAELIGQVGVGSQVRVPFRRQRLVGVVVGPSSESPRRLRAIHTVSDPRVRVSAELLGFTRWMADYYGAAWGETLRAALPGYLARRAQRQQTTPAAGALADPSPPVVLTPAQRRAAARCGELLQAGEFGVVLLHGVTASGKTELYIRAAEQVVEAGGQALVLVPEIGVSVQALAAFQSRFGETARVWHSGLTETDRRSTYWAVAAGDCRVLVGARSALFAPFKRLRLVVVDEEHEAAYKQAEQPRYHARDAAVVRARMNSALVILGSATPSLESAFNAQRGRYELLELPERVDDRSLPAVELVDLRVMRDADRHELDRLRRQRRAARQRAWLDERARRNRELYDALPLLKRATEPAARPAPTQALKVSGEAPAPEFLSERLANGLKEVVERGEQAILLVGRRGLATFVQCTQCGDVAMCEQCAVPLVHHRSPPDLRCHHCGLGRALPPACASCTGEGFWFGGVGTQRIESEVKQRLPEVRILRMDTDSTRRAGAQRRIVEAFAAREADVLIGTQMVAKGLHFPGVSLVGVVSADAQLNLPDFRAAERTFQLLTQVAGRAGRGATAGQVVIQTFTPDHPAVVAAAQHDYRAFYEAEMIERHELGYPPVGAMARLLIEGADEGEVGRLAERLARYAGHAGGDEVLVLGPATLPLARLRGRFRWHVTLLSRGRRQAAAAARAAGEALRGERLPRRVRLHIDVDPLHML